MARMLSPSEMAIKVQDGKGQDTTLGDQLKQAWLADFDEWYCFGNARIGAAHVRPPVCVPCTWLTHMKCYRSSSFDCALACATDLAMVLHAHARVLPSQECALQYATYKAGGLVLCNLGRCKAMNSYVNMPVWMFASSICQLSI